MALGGVAMQDYSLILFCCFLEYLFSHICILSPHGQVDSKQEH